MNEQDLSREVQTNTADIRHLQEDLKEFKAETHMKFEKRDEKHEELEETLQSVLRSQERLNDGQTSLAKTLEDFIKRNEEPYSDWLRNKHGPEWVKKTVEHYKIIGIVLIGALVTLKFDLAARYLPQILDMLK